VRLKNPFTEETRNLYLYQYSCQCCGRSDRGLELHHIKGRSSNSKLNAIVLCLDCHKIIGHTDEEEGKYLQITIRFHLQEKNELNEDDIMFYEDNVLLYQL